MITNELEAIINKIRYPTNSNAVENTIEYYNEVVSTVSIERDIIKQIYAEFPDLVIGEKYENRFIAESAKKRALHCEFSFDRWSHQHNYHFASPYVVCAGRKVYGERNGIQFAEQIRKNQHTHNIVFVAPLPHWKDNFVGYSATAIELIEEFLGRLTEEQQVGW